MRVAPQIELNKHKAAMTVTYIDDALVTLKPTFVTLIWSQGSPKARRGSLRTPERRCVA